jgi:tetratricopeptide (TPR) repeat protein
MSWIPRAAVLAVLAASALAPSSVSAQEAFLPALRAATKAAPTDPAAAFALGRALRRAGHFVEASRELLRGSQLGSALKGGLNLRLGYEAALATLDRHDVPGALKVCDALGKRSAIGDACRAEAYLSQNRASEALPLAKAAVAAEPDLYEARVVGGRSFALQGKVAEAEVTLRKLGESTPARPEANHWLGVFLLAQGRRDDGVAALRLAHAADPADPEIELHLAEARRGTKEAQALLEHAVKTRPSYAEGYAELAATAIELGDVAAADAAASSAVKLDAQSTGAHLILARVRNKQGRWDEAMSEAEVAKKLVPNSAAAEMALGDAHDGKGEVDLAGDAYLRAFGLDRADPTPLLRAGLACLRASRPTMARGFADKVTAEFPRFAPGWVLLGDLAAKADRERARAAYEAALKGEGPIDREAVAKKLAALSAPARP